MRQCGPYSTLGSLGALGACEIAEDMQAVWSDTNIMSFRITVEQYHLDVHYFRFVKLIMYWLI